MARRSSFDYGEPSKRSPMTIVSIALAVCLLAVAGIGAAAVWKATSEAPDIAVQQRTENESAAAEAQGQGADEASAEAEAETEAEAEEEAEAEAEEGAAEGPTVPLEEGRIVMTMGGSADTYVRTGEEYIEAGCHVYDHVEGNITANVQISGEVDTSTPGDYEVVYTVRNAEGMQDSRTRTVHVTDDIEWDSDGISVLMYHYVYTDDDYPDDLNTNYVHQDTLDAQCAWLVDNGYYYPSYQELRAYVDGTHSLPAKSVVLTFDDCAYSFLDYGIPVLEKYQVPATSFVIGDIDEVESRVTDYASEYVTFQSHSMYMHNGGSSGIGHGGIIYDMTEDQIVEDLEQMAAFLGTNEAFAYPYGDVSDAAPAAIERAGILCAFTTDYNQVHPGDNPYRLSRIRIFGENGLDAFIYQVQSGA